MSEHRNSIPRRGSHKGWQRRPAIPSAKHQVLKVTAAVRMALTLSQSALAALDDTFPGDYLLAPAGTDALVVYAYDRALEGPYRGS